MFGETKLEAARADVIRLLQKIGKKPKSMSMEDVNEFLGGIEVQLIPSMEELVAASSPREVVPVEDVFREAKACNDRATAYRETAAVIGSSNLLPENAEQYVAFLHGCMDVEERTAKRLTRLAGDIPF